MSAICFFPGPQLRPQQLPEDGAVCGASLPLEFGVTKGAVLLNVGKEVTLLHLDFFFPENMPPSKTSGGGGVGDSSGSLPTYYELVVVLRTLMHSCVQAS